MDIPFLGYFTGRMPLFSTVHFTIFVVSLRADILLFWKVSYRKLFVCGLLSATEQKLP